MEIVETHPCLKKIHYLLSLSNPELKLYFKGTSDDIKSSIKTLRDILQKILNADGTLTRFYTNSSKSEFHDGRLYCQGVQSLPKKIRGFLMSHTTDLDMANCHPTILKYICFKHQIACPELTYYVNNREAVLTEYGGKQDVAKKVFLSTINDEKYQITSNKIILKKFDEEMKILHQRILSIPEYKPILQSVPDSKKENKIGSAMNRILNHYENLILQDTVSFVRTKGLSVVALMFDGLMIDGDHYDNKELLMDIGGFINKKYEGLNIVWTYKPHDSDLSLPEGYEPEIKKKDDKEQLTAQSDADACDLVWNVVKDNLKYSNKTLFYKKYNVWTDDNEMINSELLIIVCNMDIRKLNAEGVPKPF